MPPLKIPPPPPPPRRRPRRRGGCAIEYALLVAMAASLASMFSAVGESAMAGVYVAADALALVEKERDGGRQ